ncbi:hypothetical protein NM688_g3789 [Phlebia brevispora]|uniref:Uncharacterized protein n=1 Tax=Phlebia brevispora TaxID=194682 RepID=A0ACC1T4P3_9APHY|nr:hypothetical protein NM688_g3789 [Phlebia brevispora]
MPPKHIQKGRTWGTRYDTLLTSPSASPPHIPAATTSHTPATQNKADDKDTTSSVSVIKVGKSRNDSSIFVGRYDIYTPMFHIVLIFDLPNISLPTNMMPEEVSRALSKHLAEYTEIDDEAAARLLHTLQNTQQRPFSGRILRFELARCPRTLLISYKLPTHAVYPNSGFDPSDDVESMGSNLPNAMRIIRNSGSKCTFLWDASAIEYAQDLEETAQLTTLDQADLKDTLYSPLKFDEEARSIAVTAVAFHSSFTRHYATSYTPLVLWNTLVREQGRDKDAHARIPEHSEPRAPYMANGIWEVKWMQRDDCAAALSVLRRSVPHLAVSWAHHHVSNTGQGQRYSSPTASPRPYWSSHPRSARQTRQFTNLGGEYQRSGDTGPHPVSSHALSPSSLRLSLSSSTGSLASPTMKHWAPAYSSPQHRVPLSSRSEHDVRDDTTLVPDWTDLDSPSAHGSDWESEGFQSMGSTLAMPWVLRERCEDELSLQGSTKSPSPSSSLSVQPATPMSGDDFKLLDDESAQGTHRDFDHPSSQDRSESKQGHNTNPSTPGFSYSSLTPVTPKTSRSLPQTPQSNTNASLPGADGAQSPVVQITPKKGGRVSLRSDTYRDIPEFDPLSIWVGGLDTARWGEARVKNVFEKYGNIEELEFHTRSELDFLFSKRACTYTCFSPAETPSFAFVKFSGMESSTRAVSQENSRYYDGRPIRVAIRQLNALPRGSPMKFSRGRGRQKALDTSQLRSHEGEGGNEDLMSGLNPRRSVSENPFRVSSNSPPSMSRLSMSNEVREGSLGATPTIGNQSSPASSSTRRNQRFTFDSHRAESTGAASSPAPSSVGQSSTTTGPVVAYGYWMYGYPYTMPPPRDGHDQVSGQWISANQPYKGSTGQHPSQGEAAPFQQPPLHPTGFYQNEHGPLVPFYSQDALMQYQMSKGGNNRDPSSQSSAPCPPPAAWLSHVPMNPYQYPCLPIAYPPPPGQTSTNMMPLPGNSWSSTPPGNYFQRAPPQPSAMQSVATPPHMVPSASATSVNSTSSFGTTYTAPPPPYAEQSVGPRHSMVNRRYMRHPQNQGYHNRNPPHRYNGRGGYPMDASQSFADPSLRGQPPSGPARLNGPHPPHFGPNAPST